MPTPVTVPMVAVVPPPPSVALRHLAELRAELAAHRARLADICGQAGQLAARVDAMLALVADEQPTTVLRAVR